MPHVKRFFWLPKCTTCQKAQQLLDTLNITIDTYVDVKTETVSRDTLEMLANKLGSVDKLFSKRAMKYRAWGLHEKTLTAEDMLQYMQEEYTFIRRPVIETTDGQVLAGFSKKQLESLFQ